MKLDTIATRGLPIFVLGDLRTDEPPSLIPGWSDAEARKHTEEVQRHAAFVARLPITEDMREAAADITWFIRGMSQASPECKLTERHVLALSDFRSMDLVKLVRDAEDRVRRQQLQLRQGEVEAVQAACAEQLKAVRSRARRELDAMRAHARKLESFKENSIALHGDVRA